MKWIKFIASILVALVKAVVYEWILAIIDIFKRLIQRVKDYCAWKKLPHPARTGYANCLTVIHPAFHRPDPCIYSQYWLMKLGLPVTWDNPDIELLRNGVVVPEHDLLPSTLYQIRARIWNNSYNAPVFGMPVEFSYLSFGVGTTSTAIGSMLVNIGVKGGPGHPATTIIPWVTHL
jgi:hypothetical protein